MEISRYPTFKSATTAVTICPIGDLQWAGDEQDLAYTLLENHLNTCLSSQNPLFVGMGDYIDFACIELDAEILTREGWRRHDQVSIGDSVASYDGSRLVWTPLIDIHHYDSAPVVEMRSKSFLARVTPNHKWCVKSKGKTSGIMETQDLEGHAFNLVITAKAEDGPSTITPDEAWVLGWLVSDGHIRWDTTDNFSVLQAKPQYVDELRSRLAGIVRREGIDQRGTHCFDLHVEAVRAIFWRAEVDYKSLSGLSKLPLVLSGPAREAMLDALLKAEGTFVQNEGRQGNWRFSQSVKENPLVCEVFQNLCVMEGLRLGISKPKSSGVWVPRILLRETPYTYDMTFTSIGNRPVWCPETIHGTWVMRQGEQIAITGNSPSNRERLKTGLYDTALKVISDATKNLVDDLYQRLLKPTTGKWLGLTQGHHHHTAIIGQTKDKENITVDSDVYLAKLLKAKYLDEFGFIELSWPNGGKFHIVVFHGSGSSTFPWGPLNRLWRLVPNFHADILLCGHQTKKAVAETDRLIFPEVGDKVTHKTVKMVGTGGWTKGYVNGRRTYISEGAMSPVALGQPIIHLRPVVIKGRWDVGMTVEM